MTKASELKPTIPEGLPRCVRAVWQGVPGSPSGQRWHMNELEGLLRQILAEMQEQTQVMRELVSALAEGDNGEEADALPSRYMDGTPCP